MTNLWLLLIVGVHTYRQKRDVPEPASELQGVPSLERWWISSIGEKHYAIFLFSQVKQNKLAGDSISLSYFLLKKKLTPLLLG